MNKPILNYRAKGEDIEVWLRRLVQDQAVHPEEYGFEKMFAHNSAPLRVVVTVETERKSLFTKKKS